MAKKEQATGGRGKQRQKPAQQQDQATTRTGGRGKQREQ